MAPSEDFSLLCNTSRVQETSRNLIDFVILETFDELWLTSVVEVSETKLSKNV